MVLFHNLGVNHAKDVTGRCGIAFAVYTSTPPRNSLISLNLRKIGYFWIDKRISVLMKPWTGTRIVPLKYIFLALTDFGSKRGAI